LPAKGNATSGENAAASYTDSGFLLRAKFMAEHLTPPALRGGVDSRRPLLRWKPLMPEKYQSSDYPLHPGKACFNQKTGRPGPRGGGRARQVVQGAAASQNITRLA